MPKINVRREEKKNLWVKLIRKNNYETLEKNIVHDKRKKEMYMKNIPMILCIKL